MILITAIHHHTGGLEKRLKYMTPQTKIHHHTGGLEIMQVSLQIAR